MFWEPLALAGLDRLGAGLGWDLGAAFFCSGLAGLEKLGAGLGRWAGGGGVGWGLGLGNMWIRNPGGFHGIGASSIVFPVLRKYFAVPVPGEDQCSYKAELHVAWFALGMVLCARTQPLKCGHLLSDCEVAIRAITGEGTDCAMHGLVCEIRAKRAQLLRFGVATILHWVRSHEKRPPKWVPWSGAAPALQQARNDEADDCATLEGVCLRRCALRGPWHDRRVAAKAWAFAAIHLAAAAAERLAL